jgi:NAD(P)-dependent dehydrogenase (short-subunit alcohol dehydrogenase family)
MRYALLTGVSRPGQVGEAVAARLCEDGFSVLLVARDAAEVEARAAELRARDADAKGFAADLGSEQSVATLFNAIAAECRGKLAAFVHLAGGFAVTGPVAETALEDWEKQLTINLRTAFLTARAAVPLLRSEGGSAVFFSSESALTGAKLSRVGAYAVSKSALLTFASALSQEEASSGVRVNVLAPAAIRTAANVADMGAGSRFVEREDVASTVSWLCSDEARAVTGQVIRLGPR